MHGCHIGEVFRTAWLVVVSLHQAHVRGRPFVHCIVQVHPGCLHSYTCGCSSGCLHFSYSVA